MFFSPTFYCFLMVCMLGSWLHWCILILTTVLSVVWYFNIDLVMMTLSLWWRMKHLWSLNNYSFFHMIIGQNPFFLLFFLSSFVDSVNLLSCFSAVEILLIVRLFWFLKLIWTFWTAPHSSSSRDKESGLIETFTGPPTLLNDEKVYGRCVMDAESPF